MGKTFGQILRALREDTGLPLEEVAERAGLAAAYIHEVEEGTKEPPPNPYLFSLATALRVDKHYLTLAAGRLPDHIYRRIKTADQEKVVRALAEFDRVLSSK